MDYNKLILPFMMFLRKAKPDESLINYLIKTKVWYVAEISALYHDIAGVLKEISSSGPTTIWTEDDDELLIQSYNRYGTSSASCIIYKRIPILIIRNATKEHGTEYKLSTPNTKKCRDNLHEFLRACLRVRRKYSTYTLKGQIDMVEYGGRNGQYVHCDTKTFDDVFLPDDQLYSIKHGIESFINNIPWMESNHIPSHYGILLYGTPGCGRTSIIKAIINEYKLRPHYIHSLFDLYQLVIGNLPKRPTPTDEIHLVICEDVDCTLFNRQKGFDQSEDTKKDDDDDGYDNGFGYNKKKQVSLSQVLNSIDGLVAPHNTIFIFTTNHIEELDPALIRPGRMDLHLEIKPICKETLNKFCLKFFNKEIPEDFKCKEGVLFSTLQTKIIGGSTYDDILKFMKEEEVYNEEQ